MLLAGPGVMATLTVTPLIVSLFYSSQFHEAVEVLRWICLGMMLRIVAWPIGFIIVARGARLALFATELAAGLLHVGLAWMLTVRFGVVGAGAAFFGLYVWHGLIVYVIARWMTGFRWSAANVVLALVFLPATAAVFAPWPAAGPAGDAFRASPSLRGRPLFAARAGPSAAGPRAAGALAQMAAEGIAIRLRRGPGATGSRPAFRRHRPTLPPTSGRTAAG